MGASGTAPCAIRPPRDPGVFSVLSASDCAWMEGFGAAVNVAA